MQTKNLKKTEQFLREIELTKSFLSSNIPKFIKTGLIRLINRNNVTSQKCIESRDKNSKIIKNKKNRYFLIDTYSSALCRAKNQRIRTLAQIDSNLNLNEFKERGGVFLTYHHPYFNLIPSLISRLQLRVSPITMAPEVSELFPLYEKYYKCLFINLKKGFNGGEWIFINPREKTTAARNTFYKKLEASECILMAIDFKNPFKNSRSRLIKIFKRELEVPVGFLSRAVQLEKPFAIIYAEPKNNFDITVKIKQMHYEKGDIEQVLEIYQNELQEFIKRSPELWESWTDLGVDYSEYLRLVE